MEKSSRVGLQQEREEGERDVEGLLAQRQRKYLRREFGLVDTRHIRQHTHGDLSIDYANPEAVKALNRALLKEAAANGDLSQITEVSRRFFYTQAGAEATFLLGRNYLDQNRPQAAGLCFERLPNVLHLPYNWLSPGLPSSWRDAVSAEMPLETARSVRAACVLTQFAPVRKCADIGARTRALPSRRFHAIAFAALRVDRGSSTCPQTDWP
jgi:hypothetical protein